MKKFIALYLIVLVCRIFVIDAGGDGLEIANWLRDKRFIAMTQSSEQVGNYGITYVTVIADDMKGVTQP